MMLHRQLIFLVFVLISCCVVLTSAIPPRTRRVECKGIKLTKLGCHADNQNKPRPLPQLILTDRDPSSSVYSKVPINWRKWNDYMTGLICRCASKSLSMGYNKIGLQYYGECWSGANSATSKYARDGPAKHCVSFDGSQCKGGLDCIGEDRANFVYEVKQDKPTAAPTRKPTKKKTTTPIRSTTRTPTPSNTPSPSQSSSSTPPPTPSPTPPPTPSPTPPPTPSPTPPPTPSRTPTPTPSNTPSRSRPLSSTPQPIVSPTPSGSATSTAKRPNVPTATKNPCKTSSCSNKVQPQLQCAPHCQQPGVMLPPPPPYSLPVLYPPAPYPLQQRCHQPLCPVQCAPQCSTSCCYSLKKRSIQS